MRLTSTMNVDSVATLRMTYAWEARSLVFRACEERG